VRGDRETVDHHVSPKYTAQGVVGLIGLELGAKIAGQGCGVDRPERESEIQVMGCPWYAPRGKGTWCPV
jgi:hypothetical protein